MYVKKDMMTWLLLMILSVFLSGCNKQKSSVEPVVKHHNIIPLPVRVTLSDKTITLTGDSYIYRNPSFEDAGRIVAGAIQKAGGFTISTAAVPDDGDIRILPDKQLATDEYTIRIDDKAILIFAGSPRGAFYAAQTFRQLIWNAEVDTMKREVILQGIYVSDKPQNPYRGFHIDLARHFFPKEFVYKIIDMMALYKLNKLQLHLSDDQGWRIQIDKYPDLTAVGAYREFDENDEYCIEKARYDPDYAFNPQFVNGNIYGGYYSKQDIRDIVSYAARNYIDVIPEIDMPGHMSAAIRAYPDLTCSGGSNWGKEFSEPICVCKSDVMQFVKDVWDEVLSLFPSDTVHIGSDEVDKSFWEKSTLCQQFMQDHGLNNVNKIQSYFVNEMYRHFSSRGKKMIAWDDIMVNNDDNILNTVDPNILVMYWRDYKPEASLYAAQNGNSIILTPWSWFYLSSEPTDEHLIALYKYDEQAELDPEVLQKKIGYQACVWTEHIPSEAVFTRYIFPRFQAFAEVAWSKGRNFESFKSRLSAHLKYMDEAGIKYTMPDFMKYHINK